MQRTSNNGHPYKDFASTALVGRKSLLSVLCVMLSPMDVMLGLYAMNMISPDMYPMLFAMCVIVAMLVIQRTYIRLMTIVFQLSEGDWAFLWEWGASTVCFIRLHKYAQQIT